MTYKLNLRFLIKFTVGLAIVLAAIHFVHRYQARKQVELFRHLADVAGKENKPDVEMRYLARYLALRPNDVDARERFGRLRLEHARHSADAMSAFLILEEALRRDPSRKELKRFIVKTALDPRLQLVPEAVGHLNSFTELDQDSELCQWRGICHEFNNELVDASRRYEQACLLKSDNVDAHLLLALAIKRTKDPVETKRLRGTLKHELAKDESVDSDGLADAVIGDLVQKNPNNYRAHLAAGGYWRSSNKTEQARSAFTTALQLAPDKWETILARAALGRDESRRMTAFALWGPDLTRPAIAASLRQSRTAWRQLLDRGLQVEPPTDDEERRRYLAARPYMFQVRAEVELDDNRLDQAESILVKGTEALPESADLWFSLAELRLRRNNSDAAKEAIGRLKELGTPTPLLDYLTARIHVLAEEWLDAAMALNRAQADLQGTEHYKPANLLLARCYEQIGEVDRRIEAFNRVLADKNLNSPHWLPATIGLAEARTALGQYEVALELYQSIAAQYPAAWLSVARLRMNQALQQPEASRDLRTVEEALAQASRVIAPDNVEFALLRSDLSFLKKDNPGARKLLTDLLAKRDKNVEIWIALAVQDLRDNDRSQAAATLEKAKDTLGDSATLRLARARLLIDPKAPGAAEQLRALAPTDADKFSNADRLRLVRGLAAMAANAGDNDLAGRLWNQAEAAAPYDLAVLLKQFDRAQNANDEKAIEQVLVKIAKIDGSTDGPNYRVATAMYELRKAQRRHNPKEPLSKDAAAALDKASQLLDEIEKDRPGWSRIALGQAVVADLRIEDAISRKADTSRFLDRALERYQKAVELGEREPIAVRRLMELLTLRGRSSEAHALLAKLPPEFLGTAAMSRLAAEVCLQSDKSSQALTYAAAAVRSDSEDYQDQLWLARVYWNARETDKWEAPLRKAVKGAKGDPIPLISLIECLVASKRADEAKKALTELVDTVAADQRSFVRARSLQVIGRAQKDSTESTDARQHFEQACKDRPEDIRIIRAYAEYLIERGEFGLAETQLKRINDLRSATELDKKLAKNLIALLAPLSGSDYKNARDALAGIGLLEGDRLKEPSEDASPEDLRSAATALAIQVDRASKVQAIRYLQTLEKQLRSKGQVLSAGDHFLWGQLHASLNEPEEARRHLLRAVNEDNRNVTALSYFVLFLIRQNQPELLSECERWLKTLKDVQPNSPRTSELEARLAVAQKKPSDARRILQAEETKPNAPVRRLATAYEDLGFTEDAGRLFKEMGDKSKRPEAILIYAAFLGRRKQTDKALDRCEEAKAKGCPLPTVSEAGVLALYDASNARPADVSRVMAWIAEGLAGSMSQPAVTAGLLNQRAAIFNLQGQYDEAIAIYERLLAINARDSLAMNNLGFLLAAHKRDFGGAFGWLVKAKAISGPIPEFLDTEALIHLARAKTETAQDAKKASAESALKLLSDVQVQAPSAVTYFHVALAKLTADDPVGAQLAWNEALERNLSIAELHPLERSDYESLRSRFGAGSKK